MAKITGDGDSPKWLVASNDAAEPGVPKDAYDAATPGPPPRRHTRRLMKMSEAVAREIVREVVEKGLTPGDTLPSETRMLEQYDVGRASLREALRILEVLGLITIKPGPGGGPVVADLRPRDFGRVATLYLHVSRATYGELLEARTLVESALAGMAARVQDEGQLAALTRSLERSGVSEQAEFSRDARDFHRHVTHASGNRVLDLFAQTLTEMLMTWIPGEVDATSITEGVAHDHDDIAHAIFAGDDVRAQAAMRSHLDTATAFLAASVPGLLNETIDWS